jgi:hypothetical protein
MRVVRGRVRDRETAAVSRYEEDTVMADRSSVRDAQEKTAASARNPLLATGLGVGHQTNGQIIARPVICGPPRRRARE